MTINKQGTLIATCSDKGTLIRFWDTKTGEKWHEVRRGKDSCTISHIAFDQSGDYLTCSRSPDTDGTSTIHIFKVPKEKGVDPGNTPASSMMSMFSWVSSYAGSYWSFA